MRVIDYLNFFGGMTPYWRSISSTSPVQYLQHGHAALNPLPGIRARGVAPEIGTIVGRAGGHRERPGAIEFGVSDRGGQCRGGPGRVHVHGQVVAPLDPR